MKLLTTLLLIYSWVNLVLLQGVQRDDTFKLPESPHTPPRSLPPNLDTTLKTLANLYTKRLIHFGSIFYKSLLMQSDYSNNANVQRAVSKLKNHFRYLEHKAPDVVLRFFSSKVRALIQTFRNAIQESNNEDILPNLVRLVLEILVSLSQLFTRNIIVVKGNNDHDNELNNDHDEFLSTSLLQNNYKTQNDFFRTRALNEKPKKLKKDITVPASEAKIPEKSTNQNKDFQARFAPRQLVDILPFFD
ncbi:uncharacterized protein LOC123005543 [Tribolium madens]|uniref:uncharacterized protein LOC123005543 n=1 Tax=Tribolium madens TaxID=41895 RepID=UPI001CF75911|nr:uncharacterized protein LOC123005543 [Tribolium madens]